MAKSNPNKTIETNESVAKFVNSIKDTGRRNDISALINLISENTGFEPKMWGSAIVGFGTYHYIYDSGREGDAPLTGIASRANAIVLYLTATFDKREELLAKFGKHKTSKGCIYIQKLEDIDKGILVKMVKNSIRYYQKKYPLKS
ncbi:MAG: DUF1801 domain-containing protein [Saprospiraceae bacterium]